MTTIIIITIGVAYWELSAPDSYLTKMSVIFSVADNHDDNPIKISISNDQEAR